MNRNRMLGIGVSLVAGALVTFSFGGCKRREEPVASVPSGPAGPGPAMPSTYDQQIAVAQQLVARDPTNLRAWIELGDDYFDTHQRQKAIEAYAKALELDPNNPNVLTDQGVMYREIGAYDKAIANFQKANQINPKHLQSLFNLGVVYANDLKDTEKGIKAWNRIIELDPASPEAAKARQTIAQFKAR